MPGKSKKHKKQKKKDKENPIIIPAIIPNKFSNSAESIIHELVEKIISLSISRSYKKYIDGKFNEKCFNFIREAIDLNLNINFIPHDIDETLTENSKNISTIFNFEDIEPITNKTKKNSKNNNLNNININKDINLDEIFFNNYIDGENSWNFVKEPNSSLLDRYASTMINYIDLKKTDKNGKLNNLEQIPEETSLLKINDFNNKLKETDNNMSNIPLTPPLKSQIRRLTHKTSTKKEKKNNRKNMYDVMNNFPYYDILDDDDHYVEDNDLIDFDLLRKELSEKEKLKLQEELKKRNNKKKEIDIKSIIGNNNTKQYYGKKITVDPNGNVVFIKNIKLNKLSKDFTLVKTNLKTVKENKKKEEKKLQRNNNSNKEITQENIEKEKNDKNKNQAQKSGKILPKIEQQLQKSTNSIIEKSIFNDEIKTKREPIYPSGSNYDLMNMEIGVSLRENDKFKTGGKDYFLKYNKYSKDIYEQKLKDSIEANSLLKTHLQFDTNNDEESNINNNFNISKPLNTESNIYNNNNFNQTYGFNRSVNQNNMLKTDNQSKYLMTTGNFGNNIFNTSSMNPNIKLANISSLMTSMDRLNLITEREEKRAKKTQNIFNKKSMLKQIVLSKNNDKLNEINQFTKEILKTDDWSKKLSMTNKSSNRGYFSQMKNTKPSNREIFREIEYGNKVLRNRSKGIILPVSPFTETVDFFKH